MAFDKMTPGKTTALTLVFCAIVVGCSAPASAKIAPLANSTGPTWITTSDAAQRLYQRPVHTEAFAGCEWVRVRATTGARWRPLCN